LLVERRLDGVHLKMLASGVARAMQVTSLRSWRPCIAIRNAGRERLASLRISLRRSYEQ
jgi:hypothetical protein